ncbi:hypothetical protein C2845_PM05G15980 [Panicum miliaceum]|uniref:PGG domain-containing protein n=1 Tax=Panicum miliaceum TaxID=4540 RepID=A0A3L6T0H4_PANMI|nr:hypothetical protein C2845_PM05G15980 [Panicum miliaceum]
MVGHLIGLATPETKVQLLRKENHCKETALHEAVRIGNNAIVLDLLTADPMLARFPEDGTSPLYLAILLKMDSIVETLLGKDNNALSCSGPNGQNVLHAAVLRGPGLTKKLLEWNARKTDKDLTAEGDEKGSTPLHLAAGLPVQLAAGLLPVHFAEALLQESVCSQVFKDNRAALYQQDDTDDGLFPIHVAASVGAVDTVAMFVKECGGSAGLRDAKGRTFLHVAVMKNEVRVVRYAGRNPSLAWIMNMRDNHGNTALHLAVEAGSLLTFSALFGRRQVHLSLTDAKGQTRDIARLKVPPRLSFELNPDCLIRHSLNMADASSGVCRRDHFRENYEDVHRHAEYETKERADDHADGGSPTLAGRYAFLMANTIAFITSSIATVGFMYSGSPMVHLVSRARYIDASIYFMQASITSLAAAFALAMYSVLAPVAPATATVIGFFFGPLVVVYSGAELMLKATYLVGAFWVRKGSCWTLLRTMAALLLSCLLFFWPLIFIFSWAAYQRKHSIPFP